MRVYIAGPMFSQAELEFNLKVNDCLTRMGYDTFLPQRDGFELSDLIRTMGEEQAMDAIFKKDIAEIKKADILLFIMDGRVPDDGACVELGVAYALEKTCIALKTDPRSLMHDLDNPLISGALNGGIVRSLDELESLLREIGREL